eukprot:CAMPEP_0177395952 /NCGR_PEP_ID=MMETSP0368-20130122/56439_1 /TAXON_ID=447022 ORGANISM="Scrippsiella hangoei-like, Strain SHHI-4" /NCGR_SAMPLE_ID=MMETSP0368 /ASSEMBLY_ACC=CAM_ASM_000363 /LENGTH=100 /DNA_ID=CAMNT_0018862597 /DNA_START=54 /DNA_END=357 /DNA_ORIENTATION=-
MSGYVAVDRPVMGAMAAKIRCGAGAPAELRSTQGAPTNRSDMPEAQQGQAGQELRRISTTFNCPDLTDLCSGSSPACSEVCQFGATEEDCLSLAAPRRVS